MINVASVLDAIFSSGTLLDDEVDRIQPYCMVACEHLSQRLKDENFAENATVIMACAGLALYNYLLTNISAQEFSSFKAGDITVTQNYESRIENAAKFKNEALVCAAPYLTDINFVFEAVEV